MVVKSGSNLARFLSENAEFLSGSEVYLIYEVSRKSKNKLGDITVDGIVKSHRIRI